MEILSENQFSGKTYFYTIAPSLGSYWFLSYCFPDANYANIDTDQLNRGAIISSL